MDRIMIQMSVHLEEFPQLSDEQKGGVFILIYTFHHYHQLVDRHRKSKKCQTTNPIQNIIRLQVSTVHFTLVRKVLVPRLQISSRSARCTIINHCRSGDLFNKRQPTTQSRQVWTLHYSKRK